MSKLFWQIAKYGVIGAFATAINLVVAEVSAAFLWPCLGADDVFVRFLGFAAANVSDATRATRAVGCNLIGFFIANFICWLLNRKYVFTPGRHKWPIEYVLFMGGSTFAVVCGSVVIWLLVRFAGMATTNTFVINVAVSVAVNFVLRKYFVFKG